MLKRMLFIVLGRGELGGEVTAVAVVARGEEGGEVNVALSRRQLPALEFVRRRREQEERERDLAGWSSRLRKEQEVCGWPCVVCMHQLTHPRIDDHE